jgi:PAS domain S-box-containing protein
LSDPHNISGIQTLSLENVRLQVLESALRSTGTLGGVAWLAGSWYLLANDAAHIAIVATVLYAWVLLLMVARRLPIAVRAAGTLVPAFLLAAIVLMEVGPFSMGLVWSFAAVVLAAAIFPHRYTPVAIFAYALLLLVVGIALAAGLLPWSTDTQADTRHWWVLSVNLTFATLIVAPVISLLFRRFEQVLHETRAMGVELADERAKLIQANGELQSAIRERRRVEEERLRLAAAVEQAGTLIVILDLRWRVEYVNPAFERVTGFRREEAVGLPIDVVGGLGDEAETRRMVEAATSEGQAWSGRLRNRRADGSSYEAEATITTLRNEARKPISYVAVLRDISREAALESQLRQSQKLEAIGTLAGGIAHDFNNLLVPILGCTEAAQERIAPDDEAYQLLDDVKSAAERAKELVAHILAFSRRAEPRREARAAAPIVREAARLLRAMLPAGIRIEERINEDAGAVRADAAELHQVIMNLATNAYHAMRRSGGILTLAVESVPPERLPEPAAARPAPSYIRIVVGDTGIGMDEKTLDRVFDPFFTTKAAGEGTGLGLAMVHGTVVALGGAIDVRSWPGAGTIVQVYLPCTTEEAVPTPPVTATPMRSGRGQHVLLVDDEITVRRVAHRMLERGGFRVTDVASGDEAIARFRSRPEAFDAVLTDFNMPGMNGIELARALQSIRAGTPIVLASGYVDAEALQSAEHSGIHSIVHKPFSPSEIASAVAAAVAG